MTPPASGPLEASLDAASSGADVAVARPPSWAGLGGWAGVARLVLLVGATIGVLVGLGSWAGATDVVELVRGLSVGHLALATLLTLTLPVSHAWRLQAALAATGHRLAFGPALSLTLAVWPLSSLTPAKSGDLAKAYYLRGQIPPTVTTGALLAERAVDLAVWGALSFVASLFFGQLVITAFSAAVLGGILTFLFVLAPRAERLPIPPRWLDRLRLLFASTRGVARRPGLLAAMIGLTLMNCAATILVTAVLFGGVGASVPLAYVTAAVLPAMFAGLLPFTVAGMGTRDSVMIALFAAYASPAQSLSVGLLYAFFFRWLLSLLGLPFLQTFIKAPTEAP